MTNFHILMSKNFRSDEKRSCLGMCKTFKAFNLTDLHVLHSYIKPQLHTSEQTLVRACTIELFIYRQSSVKIQFSGIVCRHTNVPCSSAHDLLSTAPTFQSWGLNGCSFWIVICKSSFRRTSQIFLKFFSCPT